MDRQENLIALYAQEAERLHDISDEKGDYTHPVFGLGDVNSSILFIGEAPGADEAAEGKPFIGRAGEELNSMLEMSGIDRSTLYVTNAVKFRPWVLTATPIGNRAKNRMPLLSEIKKSLPVLEEEIRIIAPKIVVTLGNVPLKAMKLITGQDLAGIGEVHGKVMPLEKLNTTLFPLYHPASGIYNKSLTEIMVEDLKKLKELI